MTFSGDTALIVRNAGSTLTMTNDVTATGVAITKSGAGAAEMKNVRAATLTVTGGKVTVLHNGTSSGTSVLSNLTITAGSLDLRNNSLIIRSGAVGTWNGTGYNGLTGLVASGRTGGTWAGSGIVTSEPSAAGGLASIAIATAAQANKSLFAGISVAPADVLVMYTYGGDANLDGKLNGDDYFRIDSNFANQTALGWFNGDFNYDGKKNGDDYFILDYNLNRQTLGTLGGGGGAVTVVPEPGVCLAATVCGFIVARRRVIAAPSPARQGGRP